MTGGVQHRLEIRATKLAGAIQNRVNTLSEGITPPGARPPFTTHYNPQKAADFILKNWQHPATQQWIGSMDPQSQLELHNALSQHILDQGLMPATAQPEGMSVSGGAEMNRASMMGVNPLRASSFAMQRNVS